MASPQAAGARGGKQNGQNQQNGGNNDDEKSLAQDMFREFRDFMNRKAFRDRMAAAVPEIWRYEGYVDRLIESIFVAVRDNPKLLINCDRQSLIRAAERVAKKCLVVGDNQMHLVPYSGQVEDQMGYKGCMIQVRRSGLPIHINCQTVFVNDPCEIHLGTDQKIIHRPFMDGDRGDIRGAYAFAKHMETGAIEVEWMPWVKIDEIRQRAPSKNSPAWRDHPDEMARKMPLKRACKRLPTEREIDLRDMDDRLSRTIEGVAQKVDALQLTHNAEQPINVVSVNTKAAEPEKRTVDAPPAEDDDVPAHVMADAAGENYDDLFK